ncbi:MAG: glycosyltransferase family 2 protein [Candidatus Lernaella stagnicola]|nr:glycosyltransferase family 2 protein [Candidatus Lernaella stagnicola]
MKQGEKPHLSVIVPAYNEAERIGITLGDLEVYLRTVDYAAEILVVNDGSRDQTEQVVRERMGGQVPLELLSYGGNRGKGFAVNYGITRARGAYRLFFDADGSTPIEEVEKFWPHFQKGCEVCLGSRAMRESNVVVHQPWYRETMGRTFNLMVRLLTVRGFHDTQCGFKAFSEKAVREIFARQQLNGFGFDVELLYIAQKHGLRAVEVPVKWINSPSSRVSPIGDASRMFLELLKIRWLDWQGAYR